MRTSDVVRAEPKYRPVMIITSPGLPLVGVIESIWGGRPTRRELSRTKRMRPATTTVGMNPLLLRIRWWGLWSLFCRWLLAPLGCAAPESITPSPATPVSESESYRGKLIPARIPPA